MDFAPLYVYTETTHGLNYVRYTPNVVWRFDYISHRITLILTLHEAQMNAYQEDYHLGRNTMRSGSSSPTFRRNIFRILKRTKYEYVVCMDQAASKPS
jgi:hypothetical protein